MADLATRFAAKIDRSGDHHLWTGSRLADGSGQLRVNGKLCQRGPGHLLLAHVRARPPRRTPVAAPGPPRTLVLVENLDLDT